MLYGPKAASDPTAAVTPSQLAALARRKSVAERIARAARNLAMRDGGKPNGEQAANGYAQGDARCQPSPPYRNPHGEEAAQQPSRTMRPIALDGGARTAFRPHPSGRRFAAPQDEDKRRGGIAPHSLSQAAAFYNEAWQMLAAIQPGLRAPFHAGGDVAATAPAVRRIQLSVCAFYRLNPIDMVAARRGRDIVRARHIAMYLCKTLTGRSYPDIGRRFGGRDHTTVLHGVRKITRQRAHDAALADDIARLTAELTQAETAS